MKNNAVKFGALALLLLALAFSSCKKDDTTEQEVITTMILQLIPTDGGLSQEFEWNDLDGPGGNDPTVDNILLNAGKTYTCNLRLLDRSKTPEKDITPEIEAENTRHLFVYTPDGVNLGVIAADTDDNGKPFRLQTQWGAGAVSLGTITITLKHEPDKNAANPDSTGETDFEGTFPLRIQ